MHASTHTRTDKQTRKPRIDAWFPDNHRNTQVDMSFGGFYGSRGRRGAGRGHGRRRGGYHGRGRGSYLIHLMAAMDSTPTSMVTASILLGAGGHGHSPYGRGRWRGHSYHHEPAYANGPSRRHRYSGGSRGRGGYRGGYQAVVTDSDRALFQEPHLVVVACIRLFLDAGTCVTTSKYRVRRYVRSTYFVLVL